MKKRILGSIIIIIVLICGLAIYFSYNTTTNSISSDTNPNNSKDTNNIFNIGNVNDKNIDLKGEKTTINGLTTMIPNRYSNGTIKKSSGIETYGKYDDDSIYVTVYDNSPSGNKVYQGDIDYFAYGIANKDNNPKQENITLTNHTILYVT